jgi:K(+)-stimulated pyrophosphate-energized sodium pump
MKIAKVMFSGILTLLTMLLTPAMAFAGEQNLKIPVLSPAQNNILIVGIVVCLFGMLFGFYQFKRVSSIKAHQSMLDVAGTIYETCKTYLVQQGKFLVILLLFIGACIAFYFGYLQGTKASGVLLILFFTVIGILGSYSVAWYGIRMNTLANSRMAFHRLRENPYVS